MYIQSVLQISQLYQRKTKNYEKSWSVQKKNRENYTALPCGVWCLCDVQLSTD